MPRFRRSVPGAARTPLTAVLVLGMTTLLSAGQALHPISGRRIAQVMSHLGASWLDRPEREDEEAPTRAVQLLQIAPGSAVADVGAGSGFITEKLSGVVGASGRVFAVDIQPEMIALIDARVKRDGLTNVTPVLGAPDDPKLADGSVDLELMIDVYHELSEPQAVLRHLRRALKPGGRLVLLEYRKEDPSVPIREDHKMTVADAKAEVEAEGFHLAEVNEALPRQHILIFTRSAD